MCLVKKNCGKKNKFLKNWYTNAGPIKLVHKMLVQKMLMQKVFVIKYFVQKTSSFKK